MPGVNEIVAVFGNSSECTTAPVYQYNYGEHLRIVKDDLPEHYRVDFANSVSGQSKSMLGSADRVLVPYEYFVPGSYIHAWIVYLGDDYAITKGHIIIPISPKAQNTDETPEPEPQSIIDQTIAALNQAVDAAETAITHYPKVEDGYWYIWDVTTGEYVSTGVKAQGIQGEPGLDGVSPEITVTTITGGHRITITDADGTKTVDVMDGDDGVGISSVVKTGTSGLVDTYTITYTNGQTTTFNVTNGADGAPGVSPTVAITEIPGGHRITITDATGAHSADVMDGEGGVTDVQVNGVSVLQDGVANVPVGGTSNFGVFKVDSSYGTSSANGVIRTAAANQVGAKNGSNGWTPIVPSIQHVATFYGLSKAAGADMKDIASPTVGVYPEAQKSAISQMLNAPVIVSGSTPDINALPGIQYVCGECATLDIALPASGCVDVVFESGSTPTVLTITPPTGVTVKWANGFDPSALEADTTYEINICNGLGVAVAWT